MYNLIVTYDESAWKENSYEFPLDRFGEYTESAIREKYKVFDAHIIEEIKSFPTLFVYEGRTENVRVGYLRRIKKREKKIYIEYEFEPKIPEIPFSKIDNLKIKLDIQDSGRIIGEFDRTHWALKDENLFEILLDAGLIDQALFNSIDNLGNERKPTSKFDSDENSNLATVANIDSNPSSNNKRALIMKGGGIKGLAYVGAIDILQRRYEFNWFIGTSAGAITAILLGAGYSPDELKEILQKKNFKDFFDEKWYWLPTNFIFYRGLYPAETFTSWLDELLAKKLNSPARVKLSDLPNRVTVYASRRGMNVLKFDSKDSDADAAHAARCSMSIPWVFIPQSDQGFRAYDGGIKHNYPVDQFIAESNGTQFISLFLGSEVYEPVKEKSVLLDLISIVTESSEPETVKKYLDKTVIIDPRPIGTLDFSLSDQEKEFLLLAGQTGALKHLVDNSDEYNQTKEERDEAKKLIESDRKIKKQTRKFWISIVLFLMFLPVVVIGFRNLLNYGVTIKFQYQIKEGQTIESLLSSIAYSQQKEIKFNDNCPASFKNLELKETMATEVNELVLMQELKKYLIVQQQVINYKVKLENDTYEINCESKN